MACDELAGGEHLDEFERVTIVLAQEGEDAVFDRAAPELGERVAYHARHCCTRRSERCSFGERSTNNAAAAAAVGGYGRSRVSDSPSAELRIDPQLIELSAAAAMMFWCEQIATSGAAGRWSVMRAARPPTRI